VKTEEEEDEEEEDMASQDVFLQDGRLTTYLVTSQTSDRNSLQKQTTPLA
jgi:hypothetical protein